MLNLRNILGVGCWTRDSNLIYLRASLSGVPNTKYIWHLAHQKQSIIRCVKCVKILKHVIVSSQLWHGIEQNGIWFYFFFFSLFSLLSRYFIPFFFPLLSHSTSDIRIGPIEHSKCVKTQELV